MTKQRFYPYPMAEDLELRVDAVDPEHGMDPNARYLRLWETEGSSWKLRAEVVVPASALVTAVPGSEQDDPPLSTVLTLRSRTSRRRIALSEPCHVGTTQFEFEIDTAEWTGLVEVEAHLVRTSDGGGGGAHAAGRHMVVGQAEPVRIDVDEPRRPPGDSLRIEWHDFTTSSVPWLQQHADNLFALRRSGSTEPPVLYLNQGFEHAVSILNLTSEKGYKARTRDMVFHRIAHQVWSSVLGSCLGELSDSSGEDVPLEEALEGLPPWMPPVIRDWAPWLATRVSKEDALTTVWQHVVKGDWEELLTEQLPNAIQSRFGTNDALTAMAKELGL